MALEIILYWPFEDQRFAEMWAKTKVHKPITLEGKVIGEVDSYRLDIPGERVGLVIHWHPDIQPARIL